MAIPAKRQQAVLNTAINQTSDGGRVYPTVSNKVQNPATPVPNPPALVGVDVITVTIPASGTAVVTSANIPARSSGNIPANSQAILVSGTSSIIIEAVVQSGTGSCSPFAIDTNGLTRSGSILSNGTFRAFGTNISGTPGQSVTIALRVSYQR